MQNGIHLCHKNQLENQQTPGFEVIINGREESIFLVEKNGEIKAWLDHCPHRGTPLSWMPDNYLDSEGEHLICATHGALFRVDDGICIAGPCINQALEPCNIEIIDDEIFLQLDTAESALSPVE